MAKEHGKNVQVLAAPAKLHADICAENKQLVCHAAICRSICTYKCLLSYINAGLEGHSIHASKMKKKNYDPRV